VGETGRGWPLGSATGCLVLVGVSHHTAPVEVRERLVLDRSTWQTLAPRTPAVVILSTCNRTEVYAWSEGRASRTTSALRSALARRSGLAASSLNPYLYIRTGRDALVHLMRVVAGLDSLALGEDQIRGQVRAALGQAQAACPLPAPLIRVFNRVLEVVRRIRAQTTIGRHPSLAAVALGLVEATSQLHGHALAGKLVVVLGAGAMAKVALPCLLDRGARVVLLNRTLERAELLARAHPGPVTVAPLDALPELLVDASLVVCATAARTPLLTRSMVSTAMDRHHGDGLVIVDLGVPRDVEPGVRAVPGVRLLDMDDLEQHCPATVQQRGESIARVEADIAVEADRIMSWLRLHAVSPAIAELRGQAERIRQRELHRSAARLRDLTPEQHAAVDVLTERLLNKLLHGPTLALRAAAVQPGPRRRRLALVHDILSLDRSRDPRGAEYGPR
jgi:glutamyl-tRNA reductase